VESTHLDAATIISPLESFLREYLDKTGGIWEEVEPQVYDMVLPEGTELPGRGGDVGVVRLTFDPEALPEHSSAQLASFGTPLVDRLLNDAVKRGPRWTILFGRPEPAAARSADPTAPQPTCRTGHDSDRGHAGTAFSTGRFWFQPHS